MPTRNAADENGMSCRLFRPDGGQSGDATVVSAIFAEPA